MRINRHIPGPERRAGLRTRTPLLAACAAVALAAAAPAAAPASQAPKAKTMALSVELTGIHVDRWHYQDPAYPDTSRSWVEGGGTQTLGFSTRRPIRFEAVAYSGTIPSGQPLPPLDLAPMAAPRPLKGSLRRRASWHTNDPQVCDREGGCQGSTPAGPVHKPASCPSKRIGVPVELGIDPQSAPGAAWLEATPDTTLPLDHVWSNCPPDMDGDSRPLALAHPFKLGFRHAGARISRLRRGQSVTFHASARLGATDGNTGPCPRKLAGPGLTECAVTDMTLEVTRVR